ncbi:MAG: LPS biosynthesis protein RfbU [Firmicutes bacterium HGW-Firmicutes-1]|jgi:glycosyltransferase involved in cell wall biosynthesis|nr:MAG: LPS biosynthesis protein RfbU [Firmicutes bacterium HGW-Firmicutes-1]
MSNVLEKKLIILDDLFPYLKTGFRVSEYNHYLDKFPNCEMYSNVYEKYIDEYSKVYPQYTEKIKPIASFDSSRRDYALIYTVFINGIMNYLKFINATHTPFVFTLYPGGGFWLNDPVVNNKLVYAFKSPYFRKVIVTQKRTYDYIIENGFVTKDQVEMIYGMVTHPQYFNETIPKKYYKKDKPNFDICFVSHKYMPRGIDKGYDVFIEVCKKLAVDIPDIRFHVVGNYSNGDIDVSQIRDKITFYGLQNSDFFQKFYSSMDMIISPNVPFVLVKGKNFDGFPTGCCIDATLNGVGLCCTDELHQNISFKHHQDIIIVQRDVNTIVNQVKYYYTSPQKLYKLSMLGQLKSKKLFDFNMQMEKRVAVIQEAMQ